MRRKEEERLERERRKAEKEAERQRQIDEERQREEAAAAAAVAAEAAAAEAKKQRAADKKSMQRERARLRRVCGVTAVDPASAGAAEAGAAAGLVDAAHEVLMLQQTTLGLCCMLMGVNIFWRVLRLVYCTQYMRCNVVGEMLECVQECGTHMPTASRRCMTTSCRCLRRWRCRASLSSRSS
jgi:hypothetical protein